MTSDSNIPAVAAEPTNVNPVNPIKQQLEEYHLMELDCILRNQQNKDELLNEIQGAIADNVRIISSESMTELEDALNVVTVANFKMKQHSRDRTEECKKLEEELSQLPEPTKPIVELRKEKQELILNYSKIVQDQVDEIRKERKIQIEAEEEEEYLRLMKRCDEVRAELLELSQVKKEDDDTDIDHGAGRKDDSDDDEIEILNESATPQQQQEWKKSLLSKMKEIEELKAKFHKTEDEVERLKNRLKEDMKATPSTSKAAVKLELKSERTTPSPSSSGGSSSRRVTPRRGRSSTTAGSSKTQTKAAAKVSKKRISEVEVSD